MFYFEGILTPEFLSDIFSSSFIEKLKNKQSGLNIKILKGFNKPGQAPLYSARINDDERALFTWKMHEDKKQIVLLDCLFHKEYDKKLKDKNLLQGYLKTFNIELNLDAVGLFDTQFSDLHAEDDIIDLF